ncbi:Phosphatidylglycerophosphatase A and related protein [Pararhodospirillum photometricum DSM 122]|uniref:Phosphatidylglycerophosphatase A and related protein n=2 Tax=Pararhodospirillum photometricum TaxID=1084 RepID=H6SPM1_PARPM|nr:Phosphatidylglycerophosphatase A and related protein [Pararhodospirillum photometricum DSM 122]
MVKVITQPGLGGRSSPRRNRQERPPLPPRPRPGAPRLRHQGIHLEAGLFQGRADLANTAFGNVGKLLDKALLHAFHGPHMVFQAGDPPVQLPGLGLRQIALEHHLAQFHFQAVKLTEQKTGLGQVLQTLVQGRQPRHQGLLLAVEAALLLVQARLAVAPGPGGQVSRGSGRRGLHQRAKLGAIGLQGPGNVGHIALVNTDLGQQILIGLIGIGDPRLPGAKNRVHAHQGNRAGGQHAKNGQPSQAHANLVRAGQGDAARAMDRAHQEMPLGHPAAHPATPCGEGSFLGVKLRHTLTLLVALAPPQESPAAKVRCRRVLVLKFAGHGHKQKSAIPGGTACEITCQGTVPQTRPSQRTPLPLAFGSRSFKRRALHRGPEQEASPPLSPKAQTMPPLPSRPIWLLTTWFGAGLSPKAPGTMGSLAALPFAWIITWATGPWGLFIAAVLITLVGIWASERHVQATGEADPGRIVIDEVAGQWFTLVPAPLDPLSYLVGFGLFRLFDITKPWPVSFFDRKLSGGLGIMLDDVAAAVYASAILALLHALVPA